MENTVNISISNIYYLVCSDLTDKMKRSFSQAAIVSILLHGR